ncbi:MAG: hypothetical protein KDD61_02580 [Bdellovibrionales bacterium]|nr:hypothetical protein [Bdellovibrionales bacterium]
MKQLEKFKGHRMVWVVVALILMLAGVGVQTLLRESFSGPAASTQPKSVVPVPNYDPAVISPSAVSDKNVSKDLLLKFLGQESQKMGTVLVDSDSTLQRLLAFVSQLEPEDMRKLAVVAMSPDKPNNERMLSAYMLSHVKKPTVLTFLRKISLHPVANHRRGERLYEEELVIRAQAMEGVKKFLGDSEVREKVADWSKQLREPFLLEHWKQILKNPSTGN